MHARIFLKQFMMSLKVYLRLPAAIFWLVAFPIVMFAGLATVLSGKSDSGVKLVWAQSAPALSAEDGALQKALAERGLDMQIMTPEEAEARWRGGKLAALLQGQGGHYTLRLNSYLAAQGAQADALVQQAYLVVQARAHGAVDIASIPTVRASVGGRGDAPYAAYLLPGLLGLNLLMMGLFSAGMVDVTLREKGGYKRLATTPLPRYIFLAAQVCVRLVVVTVAAAMLMAVGAALFGVYNRGSYLSLFALIVLGTACFNSLGYVLASFARGVDAYGGLANLVFLPTMMLSGVYFSLDAAPEWLQRGADMLPLTPLLAALRAVFNDGASLASQGSALAIVGVWTVVLFAAATKRFKWV
ncbi:MAG: ABC transporter permease [Burkholderiaceae bacterium]|nr:ABC transporter permease [Burkholderiaceae bacterium]